MKTLLLILSVLLPQYIFAQIIQTKVLDDSTHQPIAAATVSNASGEAVTFSNSDGVFELSNFNDTDKFGISCLGYATKISTYRFLKQNSIITLHPVSYSLPPVFVGDYAANLVKAAWEKAGSESNIYFYGKGFDLQLLWLNDTPSECYEFLQNVKLSQAGIAAREVTAARHGIIPQDKDSTSFIGTLKSLATDLQWYNKDTRIKKILKDYDFTITKIFRQDSAEIAQIHFTPKKGSNRYQEEGYYFINTNTHQVLRYEKDVFIPQISIPFLLKFKDCRFSIIQNFSQEQSFTPLSNSMASISLKATRPSGKELGTFGIYDKLYIVQVIPWNNAIKFEPTKMHIRNEKLFRDYKNNSWNSNLPIVLTDSEKDFLEYMEQHHAFQ